jgi:hypothetical protein
MHLQLAPGVTFCIASGKTVFLDVARDRYLALPERLNSPFRALLDAGCGPPPSELDALVDAGLLVAAPGPGDPLAPTVVDVPTIALPYQPRSILRQLGAHANAAPAIWRVRLGLRLRGLKGELDRLRSNPRTTAAAPPEAIAERFIAARSGRPIAGDCLVQSLALFGELQRRGCAGKLVFGVTANPFKAHCWVQTDALVLNDDADSVAPFTPILAL